MAWQQETTYEKLARLRTELARAQDELIESEAQLADRMAEIHAFEFEFEARVGHLVDELAELEEEVKELLRRIQSLRDERVFGAGYRSVEEQYRRTWQVPPMSAAKPPPEPLPAATEAQIKTLYRQLARRFHPDLAGDDADRVFRTEKMQAINDAYAARSMVELLALADEPSAAGPGAEAKLGRTEEEMIKALEEELARCRRRVREIRSEMENLHRRPSVDLSIEVKLAHRRGHDLLAEMAANLQRKIARKAAERDMIKTQFDSLNRI